MIIPPRPEYYGDTDKAKTLKGEAYQFFTFCCIGIGQALTMTRIKKFDNGNEIVAQVCRNPYGDLHGVVKIFVPPSGGEEFALICTSFNSGVDGGTQIYQAPYPPKTRGELILAGENTNGLVLPSPTYSARTNYRVNESENETVSWDYVRAVVGGSNFKFAKVAI